MANTSDMPPAIALSHGAASPRHGHAAAIAATVTLLRHITAATLRATYVGGRGGLLQSHYYAPANVSLVILLSHIRQPLRLLHAYYVIYALLLMLLRQDAVIATLRYRRQIYFGHAASHCWPHYAID